MEFLGITLDTLQMKADLPPPPPPPPTHTHTHTKLQKLMNLVTSLHSRKKCTKRELLSLIGSFSFVARVVVPGRTFLSHTIHRSCTVKCLDHFMYLNKGFRDDLDLWEKFLQGCCGKSFFLEDQLTSAPDLEIYRDAAGSVGYGGYFQGHWFNGVWTKEKQLDPKHGISIAYQELYPIVLSVLVWGGQWANKRLVFQCDNEATVHATSNSTCKSHPLCHLLRLPTLMSMQCNFLCKAKQVPGKSNGIGDSLSHQQIGHSRQLALDADLHPALIPVEILESLHKW